MYDAEYEESEQFIVPLINDFLLTKGRMAQYTDKDGVEIVVDMLLEQNSRIHGRPNRKTFGGSSSANCMREQIFNMRLGDKGLPEPDPKLIRIFEDGNWRNLQWLVIFHRMGILKKYEESGYSKKYNVSWTPDAVLDLSEYYGDEFKTVPVEIKGMNDNEFKQFAQKTGKGRYAASRSMQVATYMLASGAKYWVIFAENKNNQDFEEYFFPRDKTVINFLKARYKYMNRAIKEKKLPAIECEMEESDPKYSKCSRREVCTRAYDKKIPSLKPMKDRVEQEIRSRRLFV